MKCNGRYEWYRSDCSSLGAILCFFGEERRIRKEIHSFLRPPFSKHIPFNLFNWLEYPLCPHPVTFPMLWESRWVIGSRLKVFKYS
jgi:hypothetical protein